MNPVAHQPTDSETNKAHCSKEQKQIEKRNRYVSHGGLKPHLRLIRDIQCCVVQGCVYYFVHRLEGKWSGELQELAQCASAPEASMRMSQITPTRAISTKVSYHGDGHWILRETTAGEDGAAMVHHLKLTPSGSGVVSVEVINDTKNNSQQQDGMLTLTEVANGAQLVQRHPFTGQMMLFELIIIADDGHMTRTVNMFDATGSLATVAVSRQRRVT